MQRRFYWISPSVFALYFCFQFDFICVIKVTLLLWSSYSRIIGIIQHRTAVALQTLLPCIWIIQWRWWNNQRSGWTLNKSNSDCIYKQLFSHQSLLISHRAEGYQNARYQAARFLFLISAMKITLEIMLRLIITFLPAAQCGIVLNWVKLMFLLFLTRQSGFWNHTVTNHPNRHPSK